MKNIGLLTLFSAVIALVMAITTGTSAVYAEECFTQYGGGETCVDEDADLKVDKKIYNPKSKDYENHINRKDGSHPYTFDNDDKIYFTIVVENTGDVKIEDIKLVDVMPSVIEYNSGDGDEESGNKVVFDEFDLDPGEEKEFDFSAKVDFGGITPDDDYICVSNVAKAKGDREDNGEEESDTDYANFCIELDGKVLGKESIKHLPKTGFIDPNVALIGVTSLGLILVGYGLIKVDK